MGIYTSGAYYGAFSRVRAPRPERHNTGRVLSDRAVADKMRRELAAAYDDEDEAAMIRDGYLPAKEPSK